MNSNFNQGSVVDFESMNNQFDIEELEKLFSEQMNLGHHILIQIKNTKEDKTPCINQKQILDLSSNKQDKTEVQEQKESSFSDSDSISEDSTITDYEIQYFSSLNPIKNNSSNYYSLKLVGKIQIALVYYKYGLFKKAHLLLKQVYCKANKKINNEDIVDKSYFYVIALQSMCYQSFIFKQKGQFKIAISELKQCLKDFDIFDMGILAKIYIEIGINYQYTNQFNLALQYLEKALVIYEHAQWKQDCAKVLNRIAYLLSILKHYEQARQILFESLSILKQSMDLSYYEVYHNLGHNYYCEKEYESAIYCLNKSLEGKIELVGTKNLALVRTYNLLGIVYYTQHHFKTATKHFENAVIIYEQFHITLPVLGLAQILNNLGLTYSQRMKNEYALICFEQALQIYRLYYKDNSPPIQKLKANWNLIK